jgi:aminotransferase
MIQVFGSAVGEKELNGIRSSFKRQWLGMGPKTALFEKAFAKTLGLENFVLLNSCSSALYMAVKLLNLPPQSDVIVPSFSWVSCGHAPILAGHNVVFCDVDYETQNATYETIAGAITPRTKAVMILHYAGLPAKVEQINKLGLPIIEDVAHAVDSQRHARPCGSLGTLGAYSFDSVKNLTLGEGGGLTAQDHTLIEKARKLRYCGTLSGFDLSGKKERWWENEIVDIFPKMTPSDISASIGLAQLKRLGALQRRRKSIWEAYQREFAGISWILRPQEAPPGDRHSYFTYCIKVLGGLRDQLSEHLLANGIYTTLRFHPLHLYPIYRHRRRLPISEKLGKEALNLPLHPRLSDRDVSKIIRTVKKFKS